MTIFLSFFRPAIAAHLSSRLAIHVRYALPFFSEWIKMRHFYNHFIIMECANKSVQQLKSEICGFRLIQTKMMEKGIKGCAHMRCIVQSYLNKSNEKS